MDNSENSRETTTKFDKQTAQNLICELRESTGMNRKQFSEYTGIPYRTLCEWENGTRTMPEYVIRLLEYKIKMEKAIQEYYENQKEE